MTVSRMSKPLYQTGIDEDGRRFAHEKQWKGHRAVEEVLVEFQREILRVSDSESERRRAKEWIREYEEKSR